MVTFSLWPIVEGSLLHEGEKQIVRGPFVITPALLWCALSILVIMAGAVAQQRQPPRVVILAKCSLDFDACFNACLMMHPEGTASWQRRQYACGQQCVNARSRCEGQAGLGPMATPILQSPRRQAPPSQFKNQR